MNRNEAIEQAAQAVLDWNSDSHINASVLMDALRDALAMPKDAERVALLERIDEMLSLCPCVFPLRCPICNVHSDIRAYLGGDA